MERLGSVEAYNEDVGLGRKIVTLTVSTPRDRYVSRCSRCGDSPTNVSATTERCWTCEEEEPQLSALDTAGKVSNNPTNHKENQ